MKTIKNIAATTAVPWETLATAIDENFLESSQGVSKLSEEVKMLEMCSPNYCVGAWENGALNPDSIETIGNTDLLTLWDFYLLDTTDNTRETTKPVGKLRRNNLLRFEDGRFAPTVGITEEMRAECDVTLYLDNTQAVKYCDAGAFNAESFYNEHGMTQKLYDETGTEVRILRPWETTETKYTIGLGNGITFYLLDNVVGKSGKWWKGIFASPTTWDGIDVTPYALAPTAISPSMVCTVANKTRCFFYVYAPDNNNCKSAKGVGGICSMFYNGRTYPRVNDMQQINDMNWSRANNADVNAPYPFAEGGYHALNTFITCMEILYGTKYLHKAALFSSGISSNDGCSSEATWKENGGVRYKLSTDGAWKYGQWNNTPSDMCYNNASGKTHLSNWLNAEHPKEQCMESQMAASFAVETGVSEGVEFEFYGGTYWYKNVTGVNGLADGEMNVKVYKLMTETVSAFNTAGEDASFDLEVILRMGLCHGMNLSGDVFAYWGGGYEQVGTCTKSNSETRINLPVDLYLQPDQTKWIKETNITKNDLETFDFEKEYPKISSAVNLGDSYASGRQPYTSWKTAKGGGIGQGECFYTWDNNYWSSTINQRARISTRFRGYASNGNCSSRHLYANYAASVAYRYYAGSAQARIETGAAPLQAE